MLSIRKEQFHALGSYQADRHKDEFKIHLSECFPGPVEIAGEEALDAFVDLGIEHAQACRIDTLASVQSFLDHMVLLGAGFHRDPLYRRISAPIFDEEIEEPVERLDLMYDQAWQYLDHVHGPDAEHLFRAIAKLKAELSLPETTSGTIGEHLGWIFPEKFAAFDRGTLNEFGAEAARLATTDGFPGPINQLTYISIAFVAGIGFFSNPLILGAVPETVLALKEEMNPRVRTELLRAGTVAYADKVIAAARADAAGAQG